MKALIVDDSAAMRMLLGKLLKDIGVYSSQANDGQQGLDILSESGDFDFVLVDWQMPVLDGIEFCKAVRSNEEFGRVKLLMVTSVNQIESIVEALEAGADEYIMKPFTKDALKEKLSLIGISID
jgi:two-component system, chemotaxis family, chemotaxis protein CheY